MRKLGFLLSLILGFFLVVFPVLAQDFPQPEGYVNDFGGMLSPGFRQSLEEDLVAFESETTVEISVVTIESLEGNSLEDYAVRLFEDWQIGKKEEDNGLLILIAKEERDIRIEFGYGLEPIITDGRAGRIIREKMAPAFKEEDYDEGVNLAISQIKDYVRSGQSPTGVEESGEKTVIFPLLFIGTLFLIYLSSFLARSKRIWPGGVLGALLGGVLGWIVGAVIFFILGLGLFGLLLDYLLSRNYKKLKKAGKKTSFWSSWGGFSSGGGRSGGFGGFGGGSSGGGGASGGW